MPEDNEQEYCESIAKRTATVLCAEEQMYLEWKLGISSSRYVCKGCLSPTPDYGYCRACFHGDASNHEDWEAM